MLASLPPAYPSPQQTARDFNAASPRYSSTANASERTISVASSSSSQHHPSSSHTDLGAAGNFIYRTDHMTINLGRRQYGSHIPVYGAMGKINGTVMLSGSQKNISNVTAKLEGTIINSTSHLGQVDTQSMTRIFTVSVLIYSSTSTGAEDPSWRGPHPFFFQFPRSFVHGNSKSSLLPQSFSSYQPGASCEVTYTLKFDMVRKGLRRHESRHLPILYLPKTRPLEPTITSIPQLQGSLQEDTKADEHLLFISMSKFTANADSLSSAMMAHMILPRPLSFTSGDSIPFNVQLSLPGSPAIPQILVPYLQVTLVRRTRIYKVNTREFSSREVRVGTGNLLSISEPSEGILLLECAITAGREIGQESSWTVDGVVDVQHFLRATILPPKHIRAPGFRLERRVTLNSDRSAILEPGLDGDVANEPALATIGAPLGLAANSVVSPALLARF